MKKTLLLIWALSMCVPLLNAAPEEPARPAPKKNIRIAVADMKYIFEHYYKVKESSEKLRKQGDELRAELEKLNESRIKAKSAFNELREKSLDIMLSDAEREKKHREAQSKHREWRELEDLCEKQLKTVEETLYKANEQSTQALVDDVRNAVQRRAIAEGYDLVLDKDIDRRSLSVQPSVLYVSGAIDLTVNVLSDLNKGQPKLAPSGSEAAPVLPAANPAKPF